MQLMIRSGHAASLGATRDAQGTNFAVFAPDLTALALVLYERADSRTPFATLSLDAEVHRTGDYWHVYLEGLAAGVYYAWRVGERELLDPWAREISTLWWDRRALPPETSAMRARVVATDDYDWEGDAPLALPHEQAIIYELHVAGFTRHPSAGVRHAGTFAGLIEKLPYLQGLGITHIELLPVMAFDEQDVPPGAAARGLRNFWGYSPCAFFAPHPRYASTPEAARSELRDLVKACHRAGLGVILDLVLNHTCEGGASGPVLHFKALAPAVYYLIDGDGDFFDASGCGNTVNCNHPVTSQMLLACLEYWVREFHVDGLRLDLASVLTRGEDGTARLDAWLPGAIEYSPALARTWLIAEPWDAGGLYQLGSFPRQRFAEWNGRYRDVVRRFVRGDPGLVGELAQRLAGSSDLYASNGRSPAHSINFITCHDGFTLWDLVSYERKHNEANGEDNRDGNDANWSSSGGIEGETANPAITRLRARQVRNFVTILLLSQGVPMLLAGDELLRTQKGNNNAYCQDNELGWLDWTLVQHNADMLRFVRELIALRKRHASLMRSSFLSARRSDGGADVHWYGPHPGESPWHDPQARALAFTLRAVAEGEADLHVVMNMAPRALNSPLPAEPARRWYRAVDTWRDAPEDIAPPQAQAQLDTARILARPFSVVVLEGR